MEVCSTNPLQQGEAKLEWRTILLAPQPPRRKGMKCFQGVELQGCQRWKDIPATHRLEVNRVVQRLQEPLELLRVTQLDGEDITTSLRRMNLVTARSRVQEAFYDLRQLVDEMDRCQVTQPSEVKIHNLHIPVVAATCHPHRVWQANSPSNWHSSRTTTPKMRSILVTKLQHFGHINHEHQTSFPWSEVIC